MTDDTIRVLIQRCNDGDVLAFEKLVHKFQSYAFALAMRLLCDETESRDIVQESFVRIWNNIDRFDPRKQFTTWMYTIVTNLCVDRLRTINRNRKLFISRDQDSAMTNIQDDIDLYEIESNEELVTMIKWLTRELPMKQRLVFTLRDIQDLTVEEVAHITGLSIGSVKTNLHYARRTLRKLMEERHHVTRLEP